MRAEARLLRQDQKSHYRRQKKAIAKRRQLTAGEFGVYWAQTARRNGYSKITL